MADEYEAKLLKKPPPVKKGWTKLYHSNPPGLLVTSESAKLAEWDNFDLPPEQMYNMKTASGQKIPSRVFSEPALCVVATSDYFCQSPYSADPKLSKKILRKWESGKDKALAAQQPQGEKISCVLKLGVFFLDSENRMLHKKPLSLKIEGMFGWKFHSQYVSFCKEMFGMMVKTEPPGNLRGWIKYGQDKGPTKETQCTASLFVFRPKFVLMNDTNSNGRANPMATCTTVGYQPASARCFVADEHRKEIRNAVPEHEHWFDIVDKKEVSDAQESEGEEEAIVVSAMEDDAFEKF